MSAGGTYWVGEHGPELVTFGQRGRVHGRDAVRAVIEELFGRKFNPNQPRDPDGQWSDGVPGPSAKVRGLEGSITLSVANGQLSIRMPVPDIYGTDDRPRDTVTLDAATTAEFAEELEILEEVGNAYNARVKELYKKAVTANPDGDDEAAWAEVSALSGDGQRITGGQLDTIDGDELHYELTMGDTPGDMTLAVAVKPADAGDDWSLAEAASEAAGNFFSWPQVRKLRREVDKLTLRGS